MYRDLRGRHEPSNNLNNEKNLEIMNHKQKFPAYESHYSRRHTSRKYLSSSLNLRIMQNLYKIENSKPVSITSYRKIFTSTKLKFKPPQLDTCHKCDVFDVKVKYAKQDSKKYEMIKLSLILCTYDLQKCSPTPMLHTTVSFSKDLFGPII